ncbi:MAG: sigma-70 family RNA polymerase sigma factor [Acidimicrobiia bacterium]|nr:sigma-70 family RNA polymerase sigma factor [Acidimicrobiia bacterium]
MTRVWTWHETALDPVSGAATELRAWLAVIFGLGGPAAVDLEVVASEIVLWATEAGDFGDGDVIEVSADRPPGAIHVEVSFPTRVETPEELTGSVLDERASAWGLVRQGDCLTVWYEVAIPTAGWELEVADDADLIERMRVDERAGSELVERYDPVIRRMASRYRRAGLEADDLYQVCREALLGAAKRFDPAAGSFERYVSRTISGTLKKHLRDRGWAVRPPRGLQELVLELRAVEADLGQTLGRPPTVDEVAAESGRSPDEIDRARRAADVFSIASLDQSTAPDLPALGHRIGIDDEALQRAAGWAAVGRAMQVLEEREREIVRLRYFEDLSQREIASRVGISQMHVSRLLRASIGDMRAALGVSEPD